MKGLWQTTLAAGLAAAILACSANAAAPPVIDKTKKALPLIEKALLVPSVFDKPAPENVQDLREQQEHVKKVVKLVTPAVVGIIVGQSSGSGVIIDEDGHVLTAGHVSGKPDRDCTIILPDGKKLKAKTLGQNVGIDSGMIKITDKGPFPYAKVGDSDKLKVSEWVISIGHPGGFKPTRSTVVRVGRVKHTSYAAKSDIMRSNIVTDCTLVGGDSGGPLFDMQGRVVGIHSQIRERINENVHVPVKTYTETWDRLVKAESWGGFGFPWFGSPSPTNSAYLGVVFDRDTTDLKIDEVGEGTPAEKAGLKIGDVIVGIDDVKLKSRSDLFDFMGKKKPDDEVTVLVTRNGEEVKVKVKLGKRPG